MFSPAMLENGSGWHASLSLGFERRQEGTVLARRGHEGPLVVQKPFYPEKPETCHVYVVHPPGGVAGGDVLDINLDLDPGSHALVTTPGAAKLYRSAGSTARLSQRFALAPGSVLEWMPQETIVHPGSAASMETRVDIGKNAHFAGWEIVCLGLPASGRPFDSGWFSQGLEMRLEGEPAFVDRCLFQGGSPMLEAPWGMAGNTVCGLFVATIGQEMDAPAIGPDRPVCFGKTDGLLIGRYLGRDAWEAKREFIAVWKLWRERVLGLPACPPRIWNT